MNTEVTLRLLSLLALILLFGMSALAGILYLLLSDRDPTQRDRP
jgi:hypothetical protein